MACDEFRRMADRNDPFVCECKDGMMKRDIASERPHVRRTEDYSHPIHSDSLAISPSQVAEHKKMFPNIKLDSECRPIFDNYVEHDKYLKTCGFDKKEQRIKPKGKRIDKPKQPSKRGLPLKEI
uniref:Uncharacterized protein n=1 Tax=viral metagenome TaxID=1070528 RepID=A0A6M3KWA0_9ZZZZ